MKEKYFYRHNSSGGQDWIEYEGWKALEAAGWDVEWEPEPTMAPAYQATKNFASYEEAVADWEAATRLRYSERGCECCGDPHYIDTLD